MMRIALAWQPGLTYGNRLTLIINNRKKKNVGGKKSKLITHARHCQDPARETEEKHIHTYTNKDCLPCAHACTNTYTQREMRTRRSLLVKQKSAVLVSGL